MNENTGNWGFETKQIHAGYTVEAITGSVVPTMLRGGSRV
jgi:O-acetylhomoserine/O-acetylserine sulfhydrylase-like pyridoxal-dependent enzyme